MIEAALAHVVQNRVEAAFARSTCSRRRVLMDDWARYLGRVYIRGGASLLNDKSPEVFHRVAYSGRHPLIDKFLYLNHLIEDRFKSIFKLI